MLDRVGDAPAEWATTVVRGFASATNLLIAGRRFSVRGRGDRATALDALLSALGARRVADGAIDYLFCTGEGALALDASAAPAAETPLLVVDASPDDTAIDYPSFGPQASARPGVLATGRPGVFLVPLAPVVPEATAAQDDARHRIEWARRFMPVSAILAAELRRDGIASGVRIGVSMVLEPKTAVLALLLRDAGAEVSVFAHPDETDDAVADALRAAGLPVDARSGAGPDEHRELALAFLDRAPRLLLDDGSHLIRLAHTARPGVLAGMIGAAEETTSGLRPLRAMQAEGSLAVPVIAVNDARTKTLFDNLYGTGQSCVFAVLDLLDASLAGRTVAVAGFGHVGEGVARTVAALGGSVVVAETDPVRALQAVFAGHRVAPLIDAVASADLVVSATGVRDTIGYEVMLACAPEAVIAVAGGVPQEIAIDDAVRAGAVRTTIARKVERFELPGGSRVRILDDGGCINITAGEGNPIEIMDLSFAVQLGAVRLLLERGRDRAPGVYPVGAELDDRIATVALASAGLGTDARAAGPASSAASSPLSTRFAEGSDA